MISVFSIDILDEFFFFFYIRLDIFPNLLLLVYNDESRLHLAQGFTV